MCGSGGRPSRAPLSFLTALCVACVGGGLGIEYRFEVAAITIVWLTLLVVGVMFAFLFARSQPQQ